MSKRAESVEDRLMDVELRYVHGDREPDLRQRVARALDATANAQGSERWWQSKRVVIAAVLLVGTGVVAGVAGGLKDRGPPKGVAAGSQDPIPQDGGLGQVAPEPLPDAIVVETIEALTEVEPSCRALRWVGPRFAAGALAHLPNLEYLHLRGETPSSFVDVVHHYICFADEAVAMARDLPKLRRLRLEHIGPPQAEPVAGMEGYGLADLAVIPNLQHIELVGGSWQGGLGELKQLAGLTALDVVGQPLAAKEILPIHELSGLRHLGLDRLASIESAEIEALVGAMSQLRSLSLVDVYAEAELVDLIVARPSIEALRLVFAHGRGGLMAPTLLAQDRWRKLHLGYGGGLSPDDLDNLKAMTQLESVGFGGSTTMLDHWAAPEGFWSVVMDMPSIRSLDLAGASHIEPPELRRLDGMLLTEVTMCPGWKRDLGADEALLRRFFPRLRHVRWRTQEQGGRVEDNQVPGGFFVAPAGAGGALPPGLEKQIEEAKARMKKAEREAAERERAKRKQG